jgi:hypothetical protein
MNKCLERVDDRNFWESWSLHSSATQSYQDVAPTQEFFFSPIVTPIVYDVTRLNIDSFFTETLEICSSSSHMNISLTYFTDHVQLRIVKGRTTKNRSS